MAAGTTPGRPFFPVYALTLESSYFKGLTPAEKNIYFSLCSEFNRVGGAFYRADVDLAAETGLSVIKVRKARRKLRDLLLINYTSGFQTADKRGIATNYDSVLDGITRKGSQYSRMHRFAFNAILARVRNGGIRHSELATYVYLDHLFQCRAASKGVRSLSLGKRALQDFTGMPGVVESATRLLGAVRFSQDAPLFDLADNYHLIEISNWRQFLDPSEDENNRANADRYRAETTVRAAEMRTRMQKMPLGVERSGTRR